MKYFYFFLILFLPVSMTEAATLYFSPAEQQIYEGEVFVTEIRLNTEQEVVNAIDLRFTFPGDVLEVIELSMGGSVFGVQPSKPEFENEEGSILIQAGAPGGIIGDGLVATLFFQAKSQGSAFLALVDSSLAFLHDGKGTQLQLKSFLGDYTVVERPANLPLIEVRGEEGQPVSWRRSSTIEVHWETQNGVLYSYMISDQADEQPDEAPDDPIGSVIYETQGDGIFYFHLRACEASVCGPTSTRQILRDARAPEEFDILVAQDTSAFEGKRFLSFTTADLTSGVDHYEISFDRGYSWEIVESPYVLAEEVVLENIVLRAVDRARNERLGNVLVPKDAPLYGAYGIFAIIGGMGILTVYYLFMKRRRKPH